MPKKSLFELFVPAVPVPKGRPRSTKTGRSYTPKRTRDYESYLKHRIADALGAAHVPFQGPLQVELAIALPVPASWALWKRTAALNGLICPTTKPDWENSAKVLDACNGLLWTDDCEVVDARVIQTYHAVPGLWLRVLSIPALRAQDAKKADLSTLVDNLLTTVSAHDRRNQ